MKKEINQYIFLNSASKKDVGEIHIEGDIADSKWYDEDVTPKEVSNALKEMGNVKNLDIYINSYGGSCIAGNAIFNIIDSYKTKNNCNVNVNIRGIAASMGSGIAMVGDKVSMPKNGLFMVHKPLSGVVGNADDMRKEIEILDKVETTLVSNYMRKFTGTEEELRDLMADETWLTADEAKEYGFVDEITDDVKMVASAKGLQIENGVFSDKVADLIKEKYPNAKLDKKEEKDLNYDEKLKDYGIDEETFNAFNLESETVLNVAKAVKVAEKETETPVVAEQFVDKATVCDALGCEDITAEELINYAKVGVNPPQIDNTATEKAKAYDEIVDKAREDALKNAMRAEGDLYDEARTKKMLNALDYSEIVAQNDAWCKKAEKELNAGERVSYVASNYVRENRPVNTNDYIIG